MTEICQKTLPVHPWRAAHTRRLPGLQPVAPGAWLIVDDAHGAQMAHRRALIAERRDRVIAGEVRGAAAQELLSLVLAELAARPDYRVEGEVVTGPDGVAVTVDRDDPLGTCGRLVQEDFCIHEQPEGAAEHRLTAAVLCFPASWTLAQKIGRPLTAIHVPVDVYDEGLARRVQRLFDGLQVDRPIWRANFLRYADPELHQPRAEFEGHDHGPDGGGYLRVERQALRRLPESGAVVFSIHTFVVPFASLPDEDQAALSSPD